ncbi:hypothetical protein D1AOALGA4SA_11552 [Olavius algarvensis Delta 1 endosymbiont]|nr:hypothetical protein D1AOALGA4SA_11552 [Olavius algarvensis Delta 1 endosymbiont]
MKRINFGALASLQENEQFLFRSDRLSYSWRPRSYETTFQKLELTSSWTTLPS